MAPEAPLDLHEGICDPPPRLVDPRTGCKRWPEGLALLNHRTGELVEGRCKATNLCRYCQRLYTVETVEMLTLDALELPPTLWVVLTAREHLTREQTYSHLRQLRKAARKRWPEIEWFVQVEFQRRGALHLNLLIKGVPVEAADELHQVLVERWCARVDALPVAQWRGVVQDAGGVTRYIAKMLAHGLKAEQAPPIGWRGHRTSQTRGYLVRPASVMRVEAREALALKRELRKAVKAGLEAHDAELAAHEARAVAAATTWTVRHYSLRRREEGEARSPWPGNGVPASLTSSRNRAVEPITDGVGAGSPPEAEQHRPPRKTIDGSQPRGLLPPSEGVLPSAPQEPPSALPPTRRAHPPASRH